MNPLYCKICGSKLARVKVSSEVEIKCGYCKCMNQFKLGTTEYDDRYMTELDFERAEIKRSKRREKRLSS